jgi:RND family efflux transporter MFP subunit
MSRVLARLLALPLATAACGRAAPPPSPAPQQGAAAPAGAASPGAAGAPSAGARGGSAVPARLVAPEPIRFAPRVVATGSLKARQSGALATSVPGTLARIAVRRGDEVRAGALLAALDAGVAAAAVSQAEAAVAAARAQLALAADALARTEEISREGGSSASQLFQVRAQRDLAAAQLAQAEAQREQARVHLAHHTLRAPYDGVVTRVPDGIGITVAAGTPLVWLVGVRDLVLETSLTQEDAAGVAAGTKATVSVPASGARTADAEVRVVVPAVDPATNRVPVEIAVPNRDGRFFPNAFARAELPPARARDAWRVPAPALAQREGAFAVWVAGADGKARTLAVHVLAEEGETAIVAPEGGWPGELKVISSPPLGIAEGTLVAEAGR